MGGDVTTEVLGRGVIVPPEVDPGPRWAGAERVVVDDAVLAEPGPLLAVVHDAWRSRRPLVVELACDRGALREPQVVAVEPHELDAGFTLARDDLYQLIRATCYEWRPEGPRWGLALEARRLGATVGGPADVVLADGRPAWCDGGPWAALPVDQAVVHRDVMALGRLTPVAPRALPATGLSLDPDQEAAAREERGAVRVIAPAGSGKTRTLAARLVHLLGERGVPRDLVTAVAYNKRAERELSGRVEGAGATVRTIHSLALRTLERAGRVQVLDDRATRRVVEEVVEREVGRIAFRPDRDVLAPYLEALDEVRAALVPPGEVENRRDDVPGFTAVFPAYRDRLDRMGAVDFAEMVYAAAHLLLVDPGVRAAARSGCRQLLVDEYQDLTPAYLLFLRLLAAPTYEIFGVGDDDQTIYGHAGADPRFLVDYRRYVPGAAEHALRRSYRCPGGVVEGVGRLLGRNVVRVAKDTEAASGRDGGLVVERRPADEVAERAAAVVGGWLDAGAPPSEVCVLARVNAGLLPAHAALVRAGIPVASTIGPDVLRRTGTATVLAWLRLAADPGRMARDDLAAAVRRPSRGVNRVAGTLFRRRAHWSAADVRKAADTLEPKDTQRIAAFVGDVEALARIVATADTATVLAHLSDVIGLGSALSLLDGSRSSADRSTHLDDLAALVQVGALEPDPVRFEERLRGWLAEGGRAPAADGPDASDGRGAWADAGAGDRVTLSSVHRVKGLEWDHVLVVGVDAGIVPHRLAEGRDGVEEERRVLHVALTRCRRDVVALADGSRPSPFLAELDGSAPVGHLDALLAPAPRPVARPAGRAAAPAGPIVPGRDALVDALREWRAEEARTSGFKAFMVLKDVDLMGIAGIKPRTLVELSQCPGIGPTKLERYGEGILEVIDRVAPR